MRHQTSIEDETDRDDTPLDVNTGAASLQAATAAHPTPSPLAEPPPTSTSPPQNAVTDPPTPNADNAHAALIERNSRLIEYTVRLTHERDEARRDADADMNYQRRVDAEAESASRAVTIQSQAAIIAQLQAEIQRLLAENARQQAVIAQHRMKDRQYEEFTKHRWSGGGGGGDRGGGGLPY